MDSTLRKQLNQVGATLQQHHRDKEHNVDRAKWGSDRKVQKAAYAKFLELLSQLTIPERIDYLCSRAAPVFHLSYMYDLRNELCLLKYAHLLGGGSFENPLLALEFINATLPSGYRVDLVPDLLEFPKYYLICSNGGFSSWAKQ